MGLASKSGVVLHRGPGCVGVRMKRESATYEGDLMDDLMHISRFRSGAYKRMYASDRKRRFESPVSDRERGKHICSNRITMYRALSCTARSGNYVLFADALYTCSCSCHPIIPQALNSRNLPCSSSQPETSRVEVSLSADGQRRGRSLILFQTMLLISEGGKPPSKLNES